MKNSKAKTQNYQETRKKSKQWSETLKAILIVFRVKFDVSK
jgi:hypothetical protein